MRRIVAAVLLIVLMLQTRPALAELAEEPIGEAGEALNTLEWGLIVLGLGAVVLLAVPSASSKALWWRRPSNTPDPEPLDPEERERF